LTAEVIKAAAALYYCETKPETTTARSWVASFPSFECVSCVSWHTDMCELALFIFHIVDTTFAGYFEDPYIDI